jgi:hypothetical protein
LIRLQGLKPESFLALGGAAEAAPFQIFVFQSQFLQSLLLIRFVQPTLFWRIVSKH